MASPKIQYGISGENISQISDDECQGGICPSCRLAINKDTGRLKWCMGGNDAWRTRIRLMLIIPAVILPVAIVIIALSKSTVIGKLSMRPGQGDGGPASSNLLEHQAQYYTFPISNDIEQSEGGKRIILHPDVETSFGSAESSIGTQNLRRHRRNAEQGETRRSGAAASTRRRWRVADDEPLQELPGTKVRGRRGRRSVGAEAVTRKGPRADGGSADGKDYDSRGESSSRESEDKSTEKEEEEKEDVAEAEEEEEEEEKAEEETAGERSSASLEDDVGSRWRITKNLDDSLFHSEEAAEFLGFRTFWKGDWSKDFIRKAQAQMMLKYMDKAADPCQDFYQYACGNWEHYNPIPDDKAGFDTFETLRESLNVVLKQLLENPVGKSSESYEGSAIAKAKNLFRSCMNYEILEQRMGKPLLEFLDKLGGWPILRPDWDPNKFDWLLVVAQLRLYNNDILISEWVGPDIKKSDQYIIQLDQTTLGLPTKDYFLHPSNAIYLTAYKNYLISVATLLGASVKTASTQAEELIQFEIQLANITISPDERRNISDLYKRVTLDKLYRTIPQIDWQRYLSIILARPVNSSEPIVLYAVNYFQDLVKLLSQTPRRVIANYLFWRFIRHRVNNLDDRFQEAKQTFYYILFGREKSPSRWKNCVSQVNSNMGMAVGSIFVRKYFNEQSKNDTLSMTHEIQHAFRELLNKSNWLDPMTNRIASEKVEAMQLRIGYPDFILDSKDLDSRYKDVTIHPDKYFENILNILRHLTRIEQNKLNSPVNKTTWNAAPAIVNAYYSRNKNQIMFPAGILQPPFYHKDFPRSLNYGGIGVVIGHEITHGFDDKGRLFDKYGNLHRWWSDETINEFNQRASCLVDQYSKYVVKDVAMQIDGINTQGENIADNGGIKQAFRAYEQWLMLNKNANESLPGVEATGRQLFFLNFAQIWCGSMRPEAMKNKLKTAVHSPGRYRVIGTLSNSEDFAKVYDCPLGSPMNPMKKCLVW
ncbi:PREDICTED: endothelin-converting enzyme 1-like [Ceratosolen solmsi marchali]|uniref:Endothelin-converting enzyme 1-like n=1 Tax=Ceratosolen solmsi marchali TaxID=326594 RepID=A0AAJ7DUT5_9HYME|nr:PREDICTED: endothelin-converting enzyme 1-like [Ceratosolen solmsi marchali]